MLWDARVEVPEPHQLLASQKLEKRPPPLPALVSEIPDLDLSWPPPTLHVIPLGPGLGPSPQRAGPALSPTIPSPPARTVMVSERMVWDVLAVALLMGGALMGLGGGLVALLLLSWSLLHL